MSYLESLQQFCVWVDEASMHRVCMDIFKNPKPIGIHLGM